MKTISITLTGALLLGVSACSAPETLSPDFGNAVEQNMSLHIINPSPVYIAPEVPDMEGNRAADALKRYKEGDVTQPEAITTSDVN